MTAGCLASYDPGDQDRPFRRDETTKNWNTTGYRNHRIVKVEIEESTKLIAPLVRVFQENGVYTELSYGRLLSRMCRACKIPDYPKNRPVFVYDPHLRTTHLEKACYIGRNQFKHLMISGFYNIKGFLAVWYLYLRDRNDGFRCDTKDSPGKGKAFPENRYASKVLRLAEPQRVLRLKERTHIEIVEI